MRDVGSSLGSFLRIHHVNVPSVDLELSREFYCDKLGLRQIRRPPFNVRGIWFHVAGSQAIHITGVDAHNTDGITHFALQVTDLDQVIGMLREKDVTPQIGPRVQGAGYQAYVSDPDGNVIELIEIANLSSPRPPGRSDCSNPNL